MQCNNKKYNIIGCVKIAQAILILEETKAHMPVDKIKFHTSVTDVDIAEAKKKMRFDLEKCCHEKSWQYFFFVCLAAHRKRVGRSTSDSFLLDCTTISHIN